MEADVYDVQGNVVGKVSLPAIFSSGPQYSTDLVLRALLSEQSRNYQPQGRDPLAGLRTSATYVGRYNTYRTLRHMGVAIRPRQKLAKGAMGEVRRIPSARKGRRAHPSKVEKRIVERINKKEYNKAIAMAIAATANAEEVAKRHIFKNKLPIVVSDDVEKLSKTKDVLNLLLRLGLKEDIEKSHEPRLRKGLRRSARRRHFRYSVLLVAKDASKLEKAGRNIPGVDVASVDKLSIGLLAPGGMPRLVVWTKGAIESVKV
ncbi:MAG: 50S ribosomal protein L4 [Candidatus Micrarchaeia archaeon]